jgi:hypothetical protein
MTNKPPPVPPANRSDKGTGDDKAAPLDPARGRRDEDPDHQGGQDNIRQNTTNQGYQQDR